MSEKIYDIRERTFQFSVRTVGLFRSLDLRKAENQIIGRQFLRSVTSVSAMCEEAGASESRADFIHKYAIALKEARELHHWLRLMKASGICTSTELSEMIQEADEIKKIIAAIIVKLKKKKL